MEMKLSLDMRELSERLDSIERSQLQIVQLLKSQPLKEKNQCDKETRRFLTIREVGKITGLSRSSIYLKIQLKEFPGGYPIGLRSVRWLSSEIEDWMNERLKRE
jgi:prophage regulatory protein